jgi:hypothetical protein
MIDSVQRARTLIRADVAAYERQHYCANGI